MSPLHQPGSDTEHIDRDAAVRLVLAAAAARQHLPADAPAHVLSELAGAIDMMRVQLGIATGVDSKA